VKFKKKTLKALQRNSSTSQKVFLAIEILSNGKGQSLQDLILKETTTKLKEKKEKTNKKSLSKKS